MRKKMFMGAGALIFRNAEALRSNMTVAETLLWGHLNGNQLGVRFLR
jgi:imidazole glycerol-phosphate synthase subunit HisF